MAKLDRNAAQKGEKLLSEWAAPRESVSLSVPELQALVGRDASADVAIVARLGAIADTASVEALRNIEQKSTDKAVHKEVRRALYRLEQKGLTIPSEAPTAAPVLTAAHAIEGLLSPIDGNGDRMVWLVKARPAGVAHLYAVINDPGGLREVDLFETTRKAVREARDSLRQRNEIEMVDADWHYCDYLIDRATHWARERQSPMNGDYGRLRAVLIGAPVREMRPPIYEHLSADEVRAQPELVTDSASVLEQKELRTWFFERDTLAPFLDEVKQVQNSLIVLPEAQQQERTRMVGEKAVEQIFGGSMQASWVRRLEEMAYIFQVTRRPDVAKRALAAALALQDSRRGGIGIPLCDTMVTAGMTFWMRMEHKQEAEESRSQLVLTPQQALRERR